MEERDSFCFPKNTKNPNPSPIEKRFGFSILTVVLPVDIPTGWEPRAKQQPTGLIACGLCAAALFKSSYPLLQQKGKRRLKQKRQLSKAVFLVVQECNPNPNHFPRMQLLTLLQR